MLTASAEELLRILNADQPQQLIATYLITQARQMLDASAAAYFRVEPEQERITLDASAGLAQRNLDGSVMWDQKAFLAALSLDDDGETVLRQIDLAALSPGKSAMDGAEFANPWSWLQSLRDHFGPMLALVLRVRGDLSGVLVVLYPVGEKPEADMLQAAERFASQAALVVENAQLRRQAEQAAVLQERSRLARDLHDSVTQSLYSLTLLAEATRRLAEAGDPAQLLMVAARLGEIGQQALKEMRLLVYQLRPSVLRRVGLVRALSQRLETVERRAGVEASLVVEEDLLLPPVLEEQLYYLAQEALNNALKHAAATVVQVHIESKEGRLRLQISDDGKGFTPEDVASDGGFGLASMRERVEKLGGEFRLASEPGEGTTVSVTLSQMTTMSGERLRYGR